MSPGWIVRIFDTSLAGQRRRKLQKITGDRQPSTSR